MKRLRYVAVLVGSVVLVLALLVDLAYTFLPPSVRISQPTAVLTPIVVAGGNVMLEFALCVAWPWPPHRHGPVLLIGVESGRASHLLDTDASVRLVPPCRIIRPAFPIPPDTPGGHYTIREEWSVTDPLGPWRTWRTSALSLVSVPFMVVVAP